MRYGWPDVYAERKLLSMAEVAPALGVTAVVALTVHVADPRLGELSINSQTCPVWPETRSPLKLSCRAVVLRRGFYESALFNGPTEHITRYLNCDLLLEVWPTLPLDQRVVETWHVQHPHLVALRGADGDPDARRAGVHADQRGGQNAAAHRAATHLARLSPGTPR